MVSTSQLRLAVRYLHRRYSIGRWRGCDPSQAAMSGENLSLVGKLLRHRRHSTTADYAHLADTHLTRAAQPIGSRIAAIEHG